MAQLTGDQLAIARDLNARFTKIVKQKRDPLYTKVCEIVPSDGAFEKYPMITSVPFPTQWTDQDTPNGIRVTNLLEVDNLTYKQSIKIDANLVADSKAWELNRLVSRAAVRCAEFPDKLCSGLLDAGQSVGTYSITDPNHAFYSATHSFGGLGKNVFSNLLTGTGVNLAALQNDLFSAKAALKAILDDEGGLVNADLKFDKSNVLLRCPVGLEGLFTQILNSTWLPTTSAASGENVQKGYAELYADAYSSFSHDWDLHITAEGYRPFIYQERQPLRTKLYTPNDSSQHDHENTIELLSFYRFAFAYGFPEHSLQVAN